MEIARVLHTETDARLHKVSTYVNQLLTNKRYMHKDDMLQLQVGNVDIVSEDNEVQARGVPAIISPAPSPAESSRSRLAHRSQRPEKMRDAGAGLSHINLIVRDNTRVLAHMPVNAFSSVFFTPDIRLAIARSLFREVYFATTLNNQSGFIPLKMHLLLSETYLFNAALNQHDWRSNVLTAWMSSNCSPPICRAW